MWFGKLLRSRRETSGANSFAKISASAPPKRNERIVPTFSRIASGISITFCDKYCYASTSPTRYFLSSESMLTRLSVVKIWSSSRYTKSPFAALQAIQRDSARPCPSLRSTVSFLPFIRAKSAFVSSETRDSIRTLETHYARYLPGADTGREIVETSIRQSETQVKPWANTSKSHSTLIPIQLKKPLIVQGLRGEAGDRGRTGDLVLGKHTL